MVNAFVRGGLVVGTLVPILVAFAGIACVLRNRMRRGRFRGIQSAIDGSAFMGAPDDDGRTSHGEGGER